MQPRTSAFHSVYVSLSTHVTGMRSVHIRPEGGWQFPTKWSLRVLGDLRTNGRRRSVHVNSNWSSLSLSKDSGRDGNSFVDNILKPTNVQVNARTLPSTALLHPWRTKRRGLAQYGPVQRRKAGRSPGIWGRSRPRSLEPLPQQNARLREGRCNVATFPSET